MKQIVIWVLLTVVIAGGMFGIVWCKQHRDQQPFDADDYITKGMKRAEREGPGAQLESIEATYVTPDGRVHTEYGGELRVFWVAPGEAATESAMPGAPHRGAESCTDIFLHVQLDGDMDGVNLSDSIGVNRDRTCWKVTAPGPLFCTITAIWQRAIAAKAPNPAMATIKLVTKREDRTRSWQFSIVDRVTNGPSKTLFETSFPDDCQPHVER